jgi:ABC-type phosphate transport system substrate-binding protein
VEGEMRIKLNIILAGIVLATLTMLSSCGGGEQNQAQEQVKKIKVYCDDAIYNLMKPPVLEFDTLSLNIDVNFIRTTAFDCMAKLLGTEADAVLISRGYSGKEDTAMKKYGLKAHTVANMAYDALVFYTYIDNSIDTVTKEQLYKIMTEKNYNFSNVNPKATKEFEFVCNSHLSSEYFNLKDLVANNKKLEKNIKFFSTYDSVVNYVINNKQAIGIGYLSQVYNKSDLKCLSVSFVNSTGAYIHPYPVHQANLIRDLYPFKITHRILLLKDNCDETLALLRFLSRVGKVQKHFNNSGIVPAFGDIRLQQVEE